MIVDRLTDLTHTNPAGATINSYTYDYDDASQIKQIVNLIDGTFDYTYDNNSRLTDVDDVTSGGGGSGGDESYAYDANGNRTDSHRLTPGDTYTTDPANELASDGTYTYTYDDQGNLVSRTDPATLIARTFGYDHRDRLVSVTDFNLISLTTTLTADYTYDAFNRRIAKTVDPDGDGSTPQAITHFIYDREDVILDYVDPDATGPNAPVFDKRYLHGPGPDMILAQENSAGTVLWLLLDHLGTTRDIVDHAGAVADHIAYDSFGNVISQTAPSLLTRYLYTGREYEIETGLYYYRARFYDPTLGKFIQRDSIGFADGTNEYEYVHSRPISSIDPLGTITVSAVPWGPSGLKPFIDYLGGVPDLRLPDLYRWKVQWNLSSQGIIGEKPTLDNKPSCTCNNDGKEWFGREIGSVETNTDEYFIKIELDKPRRGPGGFSTSTEGRKEVVITTYRVDIVRLECKDGMWNDIDRRESHTQDVVEWKLYVKEYIDLSPPPRML